MDFEKRNLTPVVEPKDPPKNEVEKKAREQLKRERAKTQQFKAKYFELYDDVKINHREDW